MQELVNNINALLDAFKADAEKALAGNKAAALRARKISLEIEKTLKLFRKESVKA